MHQDHWLGDPLSGGWLPSSLQDEVGSISGQVPPHLVPLRWPTGQLPVPGSPRGWLLSLVSPPPDLPSPDPPPPAVPKPSSVPRLPSAQVPHHPQPLLSTDLPLLRGSLVPGAPPPAPSPWPDWSSLTALRLSRTDGGAGVTAGWKRPPGEPRVSFDQIRRRSLGGAGQAGRRPQAQGGAGDPRPFVCRGRFLRPRASRAPGSRAAAGSQARGDPAGKVRGGGGGAPYLPESAAAGGAPGSAVGGWESTRSPRLLCQVSRPTVERMRQAGSLSRGEGTRGPVPALQAGGARIQCSLCSLRAGKPS